MCATLLTLIDKTTHELVVEEHGHHGLTHVATEPGKTGDDEMIEKVEEKV